MPVAKTYESYTILTEPFKENGKYYVMIDFKNTERKVRWYSTAEWARMYPDAASISKISPKEVLGFNNGYIVLFRGDQDANNDWFKLSNARYHRLWGWYIVSTETIPDDLPEGIEPILLQWKDISDGDFLKPEGMINSIINNLLYPPTEANFVGEVGERLELELLVNKIISIEGAYGLSNIHLMEDKDKNVFVWTTTAKKLIEGNLYKMRGSIKEHRNYKGVNQTILSRCTIL